MNQPNSDDVYSLLGFVLAYIQTTERNFKFVTTYVLQSGEDLDLQRLQSIDSRERKKALGYFMAKIRERADLHPSLDTLMKSYLDNRNDFIHNQQDIPGWDLYSQAGVVVAKSFALNLLRQSHRINEILVALIMRWQEQTSIYPAEETPGQEFFDDIERQYGPLVDVLFTTKST